MSWVDLAVLFGVLLTSWLGWHDGLLRAVWGFAGLMLGAALAIVAVPRLFHDLHLNIWVTLGCLAIVGVLALLGRRAAVELEKRVRRGLDLSPHGPTDRAGGAVFGAGVALVVSWMLALALAGSTLPWASDQARSSFSLDALTRVDLPLSGFLAESFKQLGEDSDFDRYVDIIAKEVVVPVAAPDPKAVMKKAVIQASASVYRVRTHDSGPFGSEGTAFQVAPKRVMTAAHVVAAADSIKVHVGVESLRATIAYCDPELDVAILKVPELKGRSLTFADATAGDSVVVIGYPENGPLKLDAARVRERLEWQAQGENGQDRYVRDGYALRGQVKDGNSGGPAVNERGQVVAVVVSASAEHRSVGYSLSAQAVSAALTAPAANQVSCG